MHVPFSFQQKAPQKRGSFGSRRAKRSAGPWRRGVGEALCPAASIVAVLRPRPALRCGGTPPHFSGVALK